MPDYSESINQQYGRSSLSESILTAFTNEGLNTEDLTLDDLSRFDQLHSGGRKATRKLAELAKLERGMKILDIGCGVGGPARTLAAEFGCQVVGVDLTESYVHAAQILTDKVGLSETVTFQVGNALDMEFDPGAFDVIWSQNSIMNIEDKISLFIEFHRVLRSGGKLVFEAILSGEKEEIGFPGFWANDPSVSFMSTPEELQKILEEAGFDQLAWKDVTRNSIELSYEAQAEAPVKPRHVGLHLLYTYVPEKAKNTLQGFEDGTYLDIYAVFKRTI